MRYEIKWEQDRGEAIAEGSFLVQADSAEDAISQGKRVATNDPSSVLVTSVKPVLPEGTPFYTKHLGSTLVFVQGYRDQNLDDLYWSNKFAEKEREQEAKAFLDSPEN